MKTSSKLIIASMLCASQVSAQTDERWFEIEVLLFTPTQTDMQQDEQFGDQFVRLNVEQAQDLISAYLRPDISLLKQHLPLCDEASEDPLTMPTPEPALIKFWNLSHYEQVTSESGEVLYEGIADLEIDALIEWAEEYQQLSSDTNQDLLSDSDILSENMSILIAEENNSPLTDIIDEPTSSLTRPVQPDWFFEPIEIWQPGTIQCVFAEEVSIGPDIRLVTHPEIDFNAIPLDNIPRTLSGLPYDLSGNPYIISSDQLTFTQIATDMRRSRDFSPKLHFAWRQPVLAPKLAKPNRIIAGTNYAKDFNQAGLALVKEVEELLEQVSITADNAEIAGTVESAETVDTLAQANNDEADSNIDTSLVTPLVDEEQVEQRENGEPETAQLTRERLIAQVKSLLDDPSKASIAPPPIDNQPSESPIWQLEGLFNVYVDHYLFIELDFVFQQPESDKHPQGDMSVLSTSTQPIQRIHSYRMKQDRRVISGETHYFDHPYMGLIVQIRRFDPIKHFEEFHKARELREAESARSDNQ